MSDKKNFSVFNKLDEKYVEEADAYSASPKVEKKRRKDERRAERFCSARQSFMKVLFYHSSISFLSL